MTLLLVLCTLLNLVVMLNLLISIISGTYERVSQTQEEYSYKAKLSVISEVQISRWFTTPNFNMMNKFLLYAIESLPILQEDNSIELDTVHKDVVEVKEQLGEVMEYVQYISNKLDKEFKTEAQKE